VYKEPENHHGNLSADRAGTKERHPLADICSGLENFVPSNISCFRDKKVVSGQFPGLLGSFLVLGVFLLCLILFSPLNLNAVEGNEPIPELKLPPPEVKEEPLRIGRLIKFPTFSLFSYFGEDELGRGGKVKINYLPNPNSIFSVDYLKIGEKQSYGGSIGFRLISPINIVEWETEAKRYGIDGIWKNFTVSDFSIAIYGERNILKAKLAGYYEADLVWDGALYWGRNIYRHLFVGLGICSPQIAPYLEINWMVNKQFSISLSYRNKELTQTLESIYVNQPYVKVNPDLKPEYWKTLAQVEMIFGKSLVLGLTYKEIHDKIYFMQDNYEWVIPKNFKNHQEWGGNVFLKWWQIRGDFSFEYHPEQLSYIPEFSFCHSLKFILSYGIIPEIGSQYTGERSRFGWAYSAIWGDPILPAYHIFYVALTKVFNSSEFWIRANNITATEYEIIKGRDGPGVCLQIGLTFNKIE